MSYPCIKYSIRIHFFQMTGGQTFFHCWSSLPLPSHCSVLHFLLLFLCTLLLAWMAYPILVSSPVDPYFLFKALSSELLFRQSCLDCLLYDNHSLYITRLLNLSYNIANICLCQWFSMGEGRSMTFVLQRTFGSIWRNFFVVTTWRGGAMALVGWGQGWCKTSYNTQNRPSTKDDPAPTANGRGWEMLVERYDLPVDLVPHCQGFSPFSLCMFRAWYILGTQILLKELAFYLFCLLSEIHSTELDS